MAITPGPGYQVDPTNPNQVIPIGSAASVNNPNFAGVAPNYSTYNTQPAAASAQPLPQMATPAQPVVQQQYSAPAQAYQAPAQQSSSAYIQVNELPNNPSAYAPGTAQIPAGYNPPPKSVVRVNGILYEIGDNGTMVRKTSNTEQYGNAPDISQYGPAGAAQPTATPTASSQTTGATAEQATAKGQLTMTPNMSIVDLLNSVGQDSSYAARQELAKQYGVANYQGTAQQNIDLQKKFIDAFNKTKGGQVPQSGAEARATLDGLFADAEDTQLGTPEQQFFDALSAQTPIEAMLFQQLAQLNSQTLDRQSYAQLYAEEMAKSGIQPLQADLAQTIADIRMTEENVREELAGGGGLVLEAQARGIAAVRTKALLTKAEQLSNIIDSKNEYIDQVVQLTGMDRAEADRDFDKKLNLTSMIADYTMKMQDRARENYRQTISDVGYDGLVGSITSQSEFNSVAKTLGMSPQTLLQLGSQKTSAQRAQELDMMNYQLSVDKFNEDKRQFGMQYALEQQKVSAQNAANQIVSPYQAEKTTRNIATINSIKPKISSATVGAGSYLSYVPGSSARDFKAEVDALKANVAFSELTAMREASKTGGALGAISDRELTLLQSSLGSLDTGQSPAAFKKSLETVEENIYRWNAQALSVGKGFDYDTAKKSGYSDEEIFNYLNR